MTFLVSPRQNKSSKIVSSIAEIFHFIHFYRKFWFYYMYDVYLVSVGLFFRNEIGVINQQKIPEQEKSHTRDPVTRTIKIWMNHNDNVNMNSYAGLHNMHHKASHEFKIVETDSRRAKFLCWVCIFSITLLSKLQSVCYWEEKPKHKYSVLLKN